MNRKRYFFLLFIIILIVLYSIASSSYIPVRSPIIFNDGGEQESINSKTIKVLCWNVHKGKNPKWKINLEDIVKDKQPDFILLQEYRLNDKTKEYFDTLKMGWVFSPNIYESKHDTYSGVLTASHLKPTNTYAALSNGLEPFISTPKATLFTKYSFGVLGKEILIVNIHGINFEPISLSKFKEQLRHIASIIKMHSGPVIIAGDFNTWKKSRATHLNNVAKSVGLVQVDFGSELTDIESFFGNPLDHIYYQKNAFQVETVDVLENITSSDHKALFVVLKLAD